jgi:hypothetical protein
MRVDDGRHGDAASVVGIGLVVRLRQEFDAQPGIAAAGIESEPPAAFVADRVDDRERDRVFQTEQPAHDDRPVGPRAGQADHQPVAARLDRPLRRPDFAGEPVGLADELASRRHLRTERGLGHASQATRAAVVAARIVGWQAA